MTVRVFAAIISCVTCVAIAGRTDASLYSTAVLADNPIAYWQFEDGSLGQNVDGLVARDSVGLGPNGNYPGTYSKRGTGDGVDLSAGVPGIGGLAAHFVGSGNTNGDYVLTDTLGNFGSSINANGMTFEFWFQNLAAPDSTALNRLFGVYNDRPGGAFKTQFSLGINDPNSTLSQVFTRDDGPKIQSNTWNASQKDLKDGSWHHVVWVFKPVAVEGVGASALYIDNTLIGLNAGTHNAQAAFANLDKPLTIGGENQFGTNGVRAFLSNGNIDEFAVYSGVLTQEQVNAHYLAAVPEPASIVTMALTSLLAFLGLRQSHLM